MDLFYYTRKGWNSRARYEIRDLIEKSKIDLFYITILCQGNFMDDIRRTCILLQCDTVVRDQQQLWGAGIRDGRRRMITVD